METDLEIIASVYEVPCPDCGVQPGQEHFTGCDVERCSDCGTQRIGHLLNESCKHDPSKSKWIGEWPGEAECRERGWYCQDGHGPNPKYGSFCPCDPDDPDAFPDINRWTRFMMTGKDDLYDGCPRKPRKF